MTHTESTPTADSTACLCPADHDVRIGHTDACEAQWEMAYHAAERDRLNAEADIVRQVVAERRRLQLDVSLVERELRKLIAERDRHSSAWRRLRAAQPVKGDSTVRYVVTFGSYDDAYVLDGEFASENEALVAAARHCLDVVERHHRMPDPFTVEQIARDPFAADRDLLGELAASLVPTTEQAETHARAAGKAAGHAPDFATMAELKAFDERALADTDAIIDMTDAFVASTAAVLAIRAGAQYRADQARLAWVKVQHGTRGERWAAARERASVLADVLAEIDAVIAERMS